MELPKHNLLLGHGFVDCFLCGITNDIFDVIQVTRG